MQLAYKINLTQLEEQLWSTYVQWTCNLLVFIEMILGLIKKDVVGLNKRRCILHYVTRSNDLCSCIVIEISALNQLLYYTEVLWI